MNGYNGQLGGRQGEQVKFNKITYPNYQISHLNK